MEIDPTTQMDAGNIYIIIIIIQYIYSLYCTPLIGYYECQADNEYAIDRRGFRTDYAMVNF